MLPELPPDLWSKVINPSLEQELTYIFLSHSVLTQGEEAIEKRKQKLGRIKTETKMVTNLTSNRPSGVSFYAPLLQEQPNDIATAGHTEAVDLKI